MPSVDPFVKAAVPATGEVPIVATTMGISHLGSRRHTRTSLDDHWSGFQVAGMAVGS
jgi:hypothetical protein